MAPRGPGSRIWRCVPCHDRQQSSPPTKQDSTALITALFPHAQFDEENLPSRGGWRQVTAEMSAPRRSKMITAGAFSRGFSSDVVEHYNAFFSLGLTPQEKSDLAQYLKSL